MQTRERIDKLINQLDRKIALYSKLPLIGTRKKNQLQRASTAKLLVVPGHGSSPNLSTESITEKNFCPTQSWNTQHHKFIKNCKWPVWTSKAMVRAWVPAWAPTFTRSKWKRNQLEFDTIENKSCEHFYYEHKP